MRLESIQYNGEYNMATFNIVNLKRDYVVDENGIQSEADFLTVIFRDTGTSLMSLVHLNFADYAGLEEEWEAGTATTVLNAACDSYLTANTPPIGNPVTPSQETEKDTYEFGV